MHDLYYFFSVLSVVLYFTFSYLALCRVAGGARHRVHMNNTKAQIKGRMTSELTNTLVSNNFATSHVNYRVSGPILI